MTHKRHRRRGSTVGIPVIVLLAVYMTVVLLPLALAYIEEMPPRSVRDELSSGLAMIAFAMLMLEFVISGRFRIVSDSAGIDLTMRFHQLVARSLTGFLLIHPFLYATPLNHPLPWDSTGQLTLGLGAASLVTGILACNAAYARVCGGLS